MKIFIQSILLLSLILCSSCSSTGIDRILSDKFPIKKKISLVKHEYFETSELKTPVEMIFNDSLIYFKNFSGDSFISIFNAERGNFVRDIAPKGLGPNEFLFVTSLSKKKNGISFFDPNLHKLFSAESMNGNYNDVTYSSIHVPVDTVNFCDPMWICYLRDDLYYATGLMKDCRFAILDSTAQIFNRFGNYPSKEDVEKYSDIALGFAYQGVTACNEKADHMVIADAIGASAQFYSMKNLDHPELICEYTFVTPKFKDNTTKDNWGVTFLKGENIIGALGVQYYKDNLLAELD